MKEVGKWQPQLVSSLTSLCWLAQTNVSHTLNSLILPILLNKSGPDGKTTVPISAVACLQSLHKVGNTLECRLVKYTLKTKELMGDLRPFKPLLCTVIRSSTMTFNIVPGDKCIKISILT